MSRSKNIIVVQLECFYIPEEDSADAIAESIMEGLETLRGQGGARVIGSYTTVDDDSFRNKAIDSIDLPIKMHLRVDRG